MADLNLDLTSYTEEELDTLRVMVATEIERRDSIRRIPIAIADLRQQYINSGGDPALVD